MEVMLLNVRDTGPALPFFGLGFDSSILVRRASGLRLRPMAQARVRTWPPRWTTPRVVRRMSEPMVARGP